VPFVTKYQNTSVKIATLPIAQESAKKKIGKTTRRNVPKKPKTS
jgi:hypothetical protein